MWMAITSKLLSMTCGRRWRSIGAHADDILVVVVVGDAVHVHREMTRSGFQPPLSGRELHPLHAQVEPQFAKVDERRQLWFSLSFIR